mmetsp:Transcript_4078/g.10534  ORF Transcript_4078/g.10534 Transcript_4078/m.10534 type:complete len:210 (+) Transcript_4078:1918-2547(+)
MKKPHEIHSHQRTMYSELPVTGSTRTGVPTVAMMKFADAAIRCAVSIATSAIVGLVALAHMNEMRAAAVPASMVAARNAAKASAGSNFSTRSPRPTNVAASIVVYSERVANTSGKPICSSSKMLRAGVDGTMKPSTSRASVGLDGAAVAPGAEGAGGAANAGVVVGAGLADASEFTPSGSTREIASMLVGGLVGPITRWCRMVDPVLAE